MSVPDVPAAASAALRASADLLPAGPAPREQAERVKWWELNAESDELAERAYQQLHTWAVATEQPAAVTAAISEAISVRQRDAERCRYEAMRAEW